MFCITIFCDNFTNKPCKNNIEVNQTQSLIMNHKKV